MRSSEFYNLLMSSSDRLKKARADAGFESAAEAAERFGWKYSTYAGHENGSRGYDIEAAERYAQAFRVRPEWLAFGVEADHAAKRDHMVQVPRFRVQLSAGPGADIFDEKRDGSIPFAEDFFEKKLGRSGANGLFILDVTGDSMEPTIPKGSIVMVDTRDRVPDGSIMAYRDGEFAFIKRLTKAAEGFEATSENPSVHPRTRLIRPADDGEFQIFGRVCWVAHSL